MSRFSIGSTRRIVRRKRPLSRTHGSSRCWLNSALRKQSANNVFRIECSNVNMKHKDKCEIIICCIDLMKFEHIYMDGGGTPQQGHIR
jgi:hypothetical protein